MSENETIENAIRGSNWVKPMNQLAIVTQCFVRFEFLLNKTKEWKRFDFASPAVILDDEAEKLTLEQLELFKKTKTEFARKVLIRLFSEIKEKKEHFFPKSDETLYIEEGDNEDIIEEAEFNSDWAKSKNEANRVIAYKETEDGFYVKVDDVRVTE